MIVGMELLNGSHSEASATGTFQKEQMVGLNAADISPSNSG
jgi:hypothetical protein